MQHVDEGTIHAWLDAALPADEAAGVESHVAACAACAAAVAEARGLVAASTRILSALDDVPGDVIPARSSTASGAAAIPVALPIARRRGVASRYGRIAALFAVIATGAAVVRTAWRDGPGSIVPDARESAAIDVLRSADSIAAAAPAASVTVPTAPAPAATPAPRAREVASAKTADAAKGRIGRAAGTVPPPSAAAAATEMRQQVADERRMRDEPVAKRVAQNAVPSVAMPAAARPRAESAPVPTAAAIASVRAADARSDKLVVLDSAVRSASAKGFTKPDSLGTSTRRLEEIVVTGQSALPAGNLPIRTLGNAKLVSTMIHGGSTPMERRSVYEIRPGVTVILVETLARPLAFESRALQRPAPERQRVAADSLAVRTLTWTDASGHTLTLSGPLSYTELQSLRERVR